ncbi:MAG: glycosyltransferase [Candidatus Latescibacteria bacterium]|nr:glycosyltransferase [bacterium]MBD3424288.1 glycosyltransferase [Candidatus Latescibacterota bacterium]
MKCKILFLLPSLRAGGAEKVISFVAGRLDRNYFIPKLLVLGYEKDTVYDTGMLDITYLNRTRLLSAIPSILSVMIAEKPDIVMGSISHVNILLGIFSILFRKTVFIGREASVFSVMNRYAGGRAGIYERLLRRSYRRLSAIVCQSGDIRNDLREVLNIEPARLVVINNPLTGRSGYEKKGTDYRRIKFVTVGRLSREKGYLRLLRSLSGIDAFDFSYTIIGSGPQKEEILAEIEELGLQGKVRLTPFSDDILWELSRHDYYLQGSYVEGFPNALLESCSAGTPFIAFDCPGGTRKIYLEGVNGYLAGSQEEFTRILNDREKLKKLNNPDRVRESVLSRFDGDKILGEYQSLFRTLFSA